MCQNPLIGDNYVARFLCLYPLRYLFAHIVVICLDALTNVLGPMCVDTFNGLTGYSGGLYRIRRHVTACALIVSSLTSHCQFMQGSLAPNPSVRLRPRILTKLPNVGAVVFLTPAALHDYFT